MSKILDVNGQPLKDKVDLGQQNQKPLSIENYKNMVCPHCGGKIWTMGFYVKEVPGIEMGELTKDKLPVPVQQVPIFVCAKCGEIAPLQKLNQGFINVIRKIDKNFTPEEGEKSVKKEQKTEAGIHVTGGEEIHLKADPAQPVVIKELKANTVSINKNFKKEK